ncbi:hypothetical protein ES702_05986 [subsurface metagenome]
MRYIVDKDGNLMARSESPRLKPLRGQTLVLDENLYDGMVNYKYDFKKKRIVKKTANEIKKIEKQRTERRNIFSKEQKKKEQMIASNNKIVQDNKKTDKEKLDALIKILKEKSII